MKSKLVFELSTAAFPIRVYQCGRDNFTVEYGKQVTRNLTYAQAARELGECIFHERACQGFIIQDLD